jgi:hypothetical protein
MRHPLAAGLADTLSSRHPAHTDQIARGPGIRRIGAFLGFWLGLVAIIVFPTSPALGGESIWTLRNPLV